MENEVRVDSLGHAALITLERGARPHDSKREFGRAKKVADPKTCFFCPGNEHLTPPELERVGRGDDQFFEGGQRTGRGDDPFFEGGQRTGRGGEWAMRVFENKFPAFSRQFERAYGVHEIIVESPDHFAEFSSLQVPEFGQYIALISRRLKAAYSDRLIEWALPFKNEGADAGASLEHSHTQLVAATFVPQYVKEKSGQAKGKCQFCKFAREEGHTLHNGKFWKVFCPHASRFNYETWIVPKKHVRSLCDLGKAEAAELALCLKKTLHSLDYKVGRPPYNIIFNEAPRGMPFHFHIEILPRLARWAGFEFGSGMSMNSVQPEDAARLLKF